MDTWLAGVATGGTGLVAGLFLGFAVAVMPGLRRTPDAVFLATMQAVNRAILNPVFLLVFLGSPVLLVVSVWRAHLPATGVLALVLTAVALAVTFAVNVPLNQRLDVATEASTARAAFERRWTRAHLVRTALMLAAFGTALADLAGRG